MGAKSAVIHDGVREVHAQAADEDYATLCGLDGNDQHPAVRQSMSVVRRGEKINCPQCRQIWEHARKYEASEFAD